MSRPDEGMIHMWLDGECSADEAAYVERMVATDPEWASAVAEARGLIAASSRIVSALDAVPAGVVPAGTKAAPGAEKIAPASPERPAHDEFRVRPWMKMAAGVVLVAGTAFAIRETTREVFQAPAADAVGKLEVATAPAAVAPSASTPLVPTPPASTAKLTSPPERAAVAARVPSPPMARERSVAKATAAAEASRADATAAPSAVPPAASPAAPQPTVSAAPAPAAAIGGAGQTGRTLTLEERAERFAAMQRRMQNSPLSQVVTTGTRGAEPEKILDSPNSIATVTRLDGCWSIVAPDTLRTLLRYPAYTSGLADSLLVEFTLGRLRVVAVIRDGDALRGQITAKRVECPAP